MCAFASAVANGSFIAPYKHPQLNNVTPLVFQFYCACGVMLSSFLLIPFFPFNGHIQDDDNVGTSFAFSGLGFLAGIIFVCAVALSFSAVELIGIALAQALWSGTAIVISYLWGVVIFGDTPSNIALSATGILILVLGVIIIAYSERISDLIFVNNEESPLLEKLDIENTKSGDEDGVEFNHTRYRNGVVFALLVGVFGGSILAPLNYVSPEQSGLIFVPSFGIGAFASALCIFCVTLFVNRNPPLTLNWKWGLPLGILSGSIFQLSNIMSIVAIPDLGYGRINKITS